MSFLATLFGLGALAVAFPFLFHLIRRTPRGQQPFSSLMFLKPSPPKITRRSRLENLLLLALRMTAIGLIAAAFMRPYFFSSSLLSVEDLPGRKIAVVVDTSASMRRGDLWQQAVAKTKQIVSGLEAKDKIALFAFDDQVRTLLDFDAVSVDATQRGGMLGQIIEQQAPTWGASNLAAALMTVADQLVALNETEGAESKLQMIVVSDMQNGSQVNGLASYQWPASVRVEFQAVQPENPGSNANVRIMAPEEDSEEEVVRVQVANFGAGAEQFMVVNNGDSPGVDADPNAEIPIYVPAGTNRVVKVPVTERVVSASCWTVTGDDVDFDNAFYIAPIVQQVIRARYFGDEQPDDPGEMQYFLSKALFETPARKIELFDRDSPTPPAEFDLVIVTSALDSESREQVAKHLQRGGLVLLVLDDIKTAEAHQDWLGIQPPAVVEESRRNARYRMLSRINFEHPLFADLANPRFNDFTRIKFWKTQPVELLDSSKTIARFDDLSPALWHNRVGAGTVIGLASGWQPEHSQLALSSKFVPLVNSLIEMSFTGLEIPDSCIVNQPLPLPNRENSGELIVTRPDQTTVSVSADTSVFDATDLPGRYRITSLDSNRGTEQSFAVNLDPRESNVTPMETSRLESFGVLTGAQPTVIEQTEQMKTLQRIELENRQKLWKWLIIAALIFLVAETWLAGRTARFSQQAEAAELSPAV